MFSALKQSVSLVVTKCIILCNKVFFSLKQSIQPFETNRFTHQIQRVIDTRHPINYEQLYAQAMYELEHGERYWFDEQDELIMTENNREFEQVPAEEQLFYKYFRPAGEEEEGEWLSPAEILEEIQKNSKLSISGKKVSVFGRILQKQGVRSRRTRRETEYCVVRME